MRTRFGRSPLKLLAAVPAWLLGQRSRPRRRFGSSAKLALPAEPRLCAGHPDRPPEGPRDMAPFQQRATRRCSWASKRGSIDLEGKDCPRKDFGDDAGLVPLRPPRVEGKGISPDRRVEARSSVQRAQLNLGGRRDLESQGVPRRGGSRGRARQTDRARSSDAQENDQARFACAQPRFRLAHRSVVGRVGGIRRSGRWLRRPGMRIRRPGRRFRRSRMGIRWAGRWFRRPWLGRFSPLGAVAPRSRSSRIVSRICHLHSVFSYWRPATRVNLQESVIRIRHNNDMAALAPFIDLPDSEYDAPLEDDSWLADAGIEYPEDGTSSWGATSAAIEQEIAKRNQRLAREAEIFRTSAFSWTILRISSASSPLASRFGLIRTSF